jgi:hypothetical protein
MTTVPDLSLPASLTMSSSTPGPSGPQHGTIEEEFRVIKTCFSITIRRDRYGIPVAIMGSWIVSEVKEVCADIIADCELIDELSFGISLCGCGCGADAPLSLHIVSFCMLSMYFCGQ